MTGSWGKARNIFEYIESDKDAAILYEKWKADNNVGNDDSVE